MEQQPLKINITIIAVIIVITIRILLYRIALNIVLGLFMIYLFNHLIIDF